jgi:hypothetical protein
MAELINLNRARKAKAKLGKEAAAAENRAKFGLTKAEKAKRSAEMSIAQKLLDAHKRDS